LPAHLKSGYMGALDLAVELEAKLSKLWEINVNAVGVIKNPNNWACLTDLIVIFPYGYQNFLVPI
jgi:hypothetical protein